VKAKKRVRLSAAERRGWILHAALRAFARGGYGGASMNEIAGAAGVTKPVLYDHFPSKLKLYVAVLESIRNELLAQGAAIARTPQGPEQRFRASVEAFFRYVQQQPEAARVLLQEPQSDAVAAKLWRRVQDGASLGIATLLSTVWHASEDRTQLAAAEFVKSGLHALAQWWAAHPDLELALLVDLVSQLVWTGLRDSNRACGP
jgi:AcrR family transcriptional regulator